jgi:hypothetical protein
MLKKPTMSVSMTPRNELGLKSASGPVSNTSPPADTTVCTRPKCFTACAKALFTCSASVTSQAIASALRPSARIFSTSACASAARER